MIHKIVITGGPHTGKTTLFEGLRDTLPDAAFVEEPATQILQEGDAEELLAHPSLFCVRCIDRSLSSEALAMRKSNLLILDRSLIDTVAYARRDDCEELLPSLQHQVEQARYTGALICDFVGAYAQSDIRYEGPKEAAATHELIIAAYHESGIPTIEIPALPLDERITLANEAILHLSNDSGATR